MSNNQLFAAFIVWLMTAEINALTVKVLIDSARKKLNDHDSTEQEALNYFIDLYDSITQQEK